MIVFKALILVLGLTSVSTLDLRFYKTLLNLVIGGEDLTESSNNKAKEEDGLIPEISKGYTIYNFMNYIVYNDANTCGIFDQELSNDEDQKQPVIKVKCRKNYGNGTVIIARSVKEILHVLKPYGNSTKRSSEGNCAFVLFYTDNCFMNPKIAPQFNGLGRLYPDIQIYAIDAYKFPSFNTDFGIIGVPTMMLFHQGRPVAKLINVMVNYLKVYIFIAKNTGIRPTSENYVLLQDFFGPLPVVNEPPSQTLLYLAWIFIFLCAAYYFFKTTVYANIRDVIRQYWQDTEAQLERI